MGFLGVSLAIPTKSWPPRHGVRKGHPCTTHGRCAAEMRYARQDDIASIRGDRKCGEFREGWSGEGPGTTHALVDVRKAA